uniref:Uncharacterized protein n=1 Tax=viral metagenome TaxID=1070528 RepID=A0A6C0BVZ7_9ZZZZ
MLVRTHNGDMKIINRNDYITNSDYYKKMVALKFNRHHVGKNNQIKNIISTILYG